MLLNPRNREYWAKRAEMREDLFQQESSVVVKKINRLYEVAFENINKELDRIVTNFEKNGGLEGKDASAYIARMKAHEEIKSRIYNECSKLSSVEVKETTSKYREILKEAYNRTIFDVQKGLGVGFSFAGIPEKAIKETLHTKWSGQNYSKRVWNNTKRLAKNASKIIKSGMLSGASISVMTRQLQDVMQTGKFLAMRVIRTETNYFYNQGELMAYRETGVTKYEYLATLDKKTSELCQELDGKVFLLKDAIVGKNYPPMHPFCRSTTVAVFDDKVLSNLERRAKNPDTGEIYLVPANMSYSEWKESL